MHTAAWLEILIMAVLQARAKMFVLKTDTGRKHPVCLTRQLPIQAAVQCLRVSTLRCARVNLGFFPVSFLDCDTFILLTGISQAASQNMFR